jgi:hypothetical protein
MAGARWPAPQGNLSHGIGGAEQRWRVDDMDGLSTVRVAGDRRRVATGSRMTRC